MKKTFTRLVKPFARIWTRAKAYWLGCTRNPRKPSFASAHSYAFTLAEVLITLTILGVVAAISIPSLIQGYKKQQTLSQIKVAYSTFDKAFEMSKVENGPVENWQWPYNSDITDTQFIDKYIAPYLNLLEKCANSGHDFCRHTFDCDEYYDTCFYFADGTPSRQAYWYRMLKLKNGMDVAINIAPNGKAVYFAIDVSGKSGPRKAGVDVFGFQFRAHESENAYGKFTTNMSNNTKFKNYKEVMTSGLGRCNTSGGDSLGLNCTHLLELNRWKFPSDYPIKF